MSTEERPAHEFGSVHRWIRSNILGLVAIFLALSGSAVATQVASKQGATSAKAKAKKGPRGPAGPAGLQGAIGLTGPQGPSALKLDFDQPETDNTIRTLGTQDELTVKARCLQGSGNALVQLILNSSVAATVNLTQSESELTTATQVTNEAFTLTAGVDNTNPAFVSQTSLSKRRNVVAIYRNANRVITFTISMVANDGTGRCQLQGTAVPAS